MGRFDKPKPPGDAAKPPGRPFDITEYTAAAAGITRTANELQQLIAAIQSGAPAVAQSADRAASNLQAVIDHVLWRATLFGLLLIAGGFGGALAYRRFTRN
jgi:hypothetical protein